MWCLSLPLHTILISILERYGYYPENIEDGPHISIKNCVSMSILSSWKLVQHSDDYLTSNLLGVIDML
jgi:hypothetical protein